MKPAVTFWLLLVFLAFCATTATFMFQPKEPIYSHETATPPKLDEFEAKDGATVAKVRTASGCKYYLLPSFNQKNDVSDLLGDYEKYSATSFIRFAVLFYKNLSVSRVSFSAEVSFFDDKGVLEDLTESEITYLNELRRFRENEISRSTSK